MRIRVKPGELLRSIALALAIGVLQLIFLMYAWALIALYSPILSWLQSTGLKGASLWSVVLFTDSLTNLALCLPGAYALCLLRPKKLALYLALAVIPGFLWQYRLFFTEADRFDNWTIFIPGALSAALTLPVAAAIMRFFIKREAA
jgi:hypothetical protein